MESALHDQEALSLHPVDESMLLGDSPGQPAVETVLERLWLADAGKWISQGIPNEFVDPLENLAVVLLPIEVVFPAVGKPCQSHSSPDWILPAE